MELESRLGPPTEILLYLNAGTAASTAGSAVNTAAFMNNSLTTTSGACDDVLGASTWSHQPVDLYYRCF
jgi:hypothetical protein